MILTFVVVVFFDPFGVTLTLMVQEPGRSAFTDVPDTEQNFFVVTATTRTTLAPFGILTLAVLLIVVKEVTLPFFMTATFETTVGVYVLVLVYVGVFVGVPVLTEVAETVHGALFT